MTDGGALGTRAPDRPFHAGMAWLFVVVAVVGFAPRSLAILGGTMASPPLVVHLHAAVMASWTVLLALQATLWLRAGLASLVMSGPRCCSC